ncbi:precorrin-8X methylmutase [Arachnia propionica]|uniref:Precorrin-8X methylmutase n=1 Tax=Arachnia propionica TaxID=1750 RepID=A0A3N4D463_9ACTN|nr:precorrin-8X methylmutase [Arachnia propionica]AFN46329.1 precorrin-8X methylmutase [Arachnia propionica F0230a]QCT37573.1 precorrin-8X methylmutase [Arachnia propionica]QUC10069.1 precorrin-8X methylmutase [Arachnia propionica]QUC15245.1 precorrin-8X methylmutase [Arachnia propionica]RPA19267.1 precorrin-8X methylmutase [Arachnia propionica]
MVKRPERRYSYETNGSAISKESFRIVREGADLTAFTPDEAQVAVRMIHTAGDLDLPRHIVFHPGLVSAARGALRGGAPIFVDANMVKSGITRRRLPADNEVHCFLRDQRAAVLAAEWGTTRSAAAVSLWGDDLEGAVVAIGNAPTALFHLLEVIADGGPRPAAIIGVPVGFVGSAESKQALADSDFGVPWLVVHGYRGGSALAASAINALASEFEL